MARILKEGNPRNDIAYIVLIVTAVILVVLAITAIIFDRNNIMPIFNVLLPVLASWVGTVLAFYFGRENFESANEQVRQLVQNMNSDQAAAQPVTTAMRNLPDIAYYSLAKDRDEKSVTLKDLKKFMAQKKVSRLPVLDAEKRPKYMVHDASFLKYLTLPGKKEEDKLDDFLAEMKNQCKMEFGLNNGFVIVSEKTTLAEAGKKMNNIPFCRDVFVTKNGDPDEPITGWLSDSRLAKFIEA